MSVCVFVCACVFVCVRVYVDVADSNNDGGVSADEFKMMDKLLQVSPSLPPSLPPSLSPSLGGCVQDDG